MISVRTLPEVFLDEIGDIEGTVHIFAVMCNRTASKTCLFCDAMNLCAIGLPFAGVLNGDPGFSDSAVFDEGHEIVRKTIRLLPMQHMSGT